MLATLAEPFTVADRELHHLGVDRDRLRRAGRRPGGADPRRRRGDVPREGGRQGAPRRLRRAHAPPACSRAWTSRPTCGARSSGERCRSCSSRSCARQTRRAGGRSRRCAAGRSDPSEFVAIAEETGLIVPLGRFVLAEAARRAAEWGARVSVNVSARQLARPGLHALRRGGARGLGATPERPAARGHRAGDGPGPGARAAHADRPAHRLGRRPPTSTTSARARRRCASCTASPATRSRSTAGS